MANTERTMGYPAAPGYLNVARRLLTLDTVCRWLVIVCLTLAVTAPAWADTTATNAAQATAAAAERSASQLASRRQQLASHYQDQTEAVAELKRSKGFNRDRDLRTAMANAQDTANQLDSLQREIDAAQAKLVTARRAWLAAIDGELVDATGPRADQLKATRTRLAPLVGPPRKKIVLPDATLDLNADPEDLEQQAKAIRETEGELARQVAGADAQADDLAKQAELLKHHQRAVELTAREDDQAHRNASHSTTTSGGAFDAAPTAADHGGGAAVQTPVTTFENDAPVVLVDVIDASALKALTVAQRSGDPAARAAAVRGARDRVKARLDALHLKRLQIEAQARKNKH
jgi:hypothetical protein